VDSEIGGAVTDKAEVVIVGAGIVGASIAYQLAAAGCRDVLVLEREPYLGRGSTGKSMGGIRAQFSTELNIRLSIYALDFFARFEEVTGCPAGYRPQGYLFVATTQEHLACLRANSQLQRACGLTTVELLSPREVLGLMPLLRGDDILGGSFNPTDGFVDPYSVMTGCIEGAIAKGARLWKAAQVTAIWRDAQGVAGVETTRGPVATRVVVNAAGPWAAHVAALAGVQLPVEPLRRMLVPSEAFPLVRRDAPMTIDMATGFHFRPEGLGVLLAWNDPEETPGFKTEFDPAFTEKILRRAVNRVPCFDALEVNPKRAWAGLYEMTPDHYPVLGPVPEIPGLFLANGFSGHGVMHSPATGKVLADLILKGHTDLIDARALNLARFAEGRLIHETAVL
jgi:sarcosine oxidase, subunit beta